jgi:hypothetical protein
MQFLPTIARWAVTATSADSTKGANMSTDTVFFEELLVGWRGALMDCGDEINQKIEEWDDKIDLGGQSECKEHRVLLAAVHGLEELHRPVSGPDITRWFASWVQNQLMAAMHIATGFFDSDEKFTPRRAALRACVNEIKQKIGEWDDKISLGGPSEGEEHMVLRAAVHGLEELHRPVSGPDITRWFASWVQNQLMAAMHTID